MLSYSAVAKSLSSVIPDKVVNINRVSSKDCRDTALFGRSKLSEIANLKNYNITSMQIEHFLLTICKHQVQSFLFVAFKTHYTNYIDNTLHYTDWDLHTLACVMQTL